MKLWLIWVVASVVSFRLGGRLGRAMGPIEDAILIGYLSLSLSLLVAGLLQWAMLRPLLGVDRTWFAASVTAVVGMGVAVYGLGALNRDVGWVLGVILGWVLLGVLQGALLRETVPEVGWWVAGHVLALIVAGPGVAFMTWLTGAPVDTVFGNLLRWAAFGAAYGATTGSTLSWLLHDRPSLGT